MKLRKTFLIVALLIGLISLGASGASWTPRAHEEDSVHTSGHTGNLVLGVRNDTLAALAGTDGDYAVFQFDASGNLYTTSAVSAMVPGVGATNLGKAEEGTPASGETGVMILTIRDNTPPTATAVDGKYAALLTNATGNLYVVDEAAAVILGTIDADTGAIKTAIELIDHLTAANSGNKDANTQRVVLATDDIPTALTNTSIGATDAAAATAGSTGSVNAKLRLLTTLANDIATDTGTIDVDTNDIATNTGNMDTSLNNIETAVQLIDNNVLASQTLIRQTFVSAALASDGVFTIVTDPAAATVPKIVS